MMNNVEGRDGRNGGGKRGTGKGGASFSAKIELRYCLVMCVLLDFFQPPYELTALLPFFASDLSS